MIEFRHAKLTEEYCKQWHIFSYDFINLYKDGIKLSNTLYRIGGFSSKIKDGYFMLLKHVEAFYNDSIVLDPLEKAHLESNWCILNENGEEKIVFSHFKAPYLQGGLVYSLDNKYYNIETNECFGESYKVAFNTANFLFLHTEYEKDETKRGVMKINKFDGTFELFN